MFADAEAYERFMGRWSRLLAPQLVRFSELPDSGRILDVGSGTGALAFAVARSKRGQVLGIDPAQEYVTFAKSRNSFPDRVSFEVGDAQKLRFAAGEFQSSVSLLVFNFIPDPAKALREVSRVTTAGGVVSAAVWDYGDGMRMLRLFWDAAVSLDPGADKRDEKHMSLCRSGELKALWTRGGLADVAAAPLEIRMQFASFADFWDPFLLGQGPAGAYVHSLDKARRQALRRDVTRRLGIESEHAPFALPARAWAVKGIVPKR